MNLPLSGPGSERRVVRICVLLALAFIALAVNEFFQTAPRVFKGRSAGSSAFLFEHFGAAGLAARWLVPAALLLCFARLFWRHAIKAPGDRWYRR